MLVRVVSFYPFVVHDKYDTQKVGKNRSFTETYRKDQQENSCNYLSVRFADVNCEFKMKEEI